MDSAAKEIADRKALTTFERFVQYFAFAVAGIGIIAIVVFLVLLWIMGYRVNSHVDPSVSALVGDFIGGIAGSLFALSATLLFYLALTLQRREFQNSLHELRISSAALSATEKHHQHTLQVMREEKEFNVCMAAIKDLEEDWKSLGGEGTTWSKIRNDWVNRFNNPIFYGAGGFYTGYQSGNTAPFDFREYERVVDIIERADWIVDSIVSKSVSTDDRKYLEQMVRPILRHISARMDEAIGGMERNANVLISQASTIASFNMDVSQIVQHKNRMRTSLSGRIDEIRGKLQVVS